MKIIKEDIANLERCIENDRVDAVGSMPITMADAFYQSQKNDEELEEQEKDAVKVPEPEKVIGAEKQPVPKMPEEPKLNLEESLFEDYNSDVRHYSDMLFDMIEEDMVDAKQIAQSLIYWCSEDDIERFMEVNELIWDEDEEEEVEEEEIEEERLKEEKEDKFHKGQKVKYNGKVTTIIDIENDPKYGIDLLIKNPDWDGKDNKSENIWVADKVELIDEESLKEDKKTDNLYFYFDGDEQDRDEFLDLAAHTYTNPPEYPKTGYYSRSAWNSLDAVDGQYLFLDFDALYLEDSSWFYSKDNIPSNAPIFESLKKKNKNLKEGRKTSPLVDQSGNSYDDEDRSEGQDELGNDIYNDVLDELSVADSNLYRRTKIPEIPQWRRYNYLDIGMDDDLNIIVYQKDESGFDLAKKVAEVYGLETRGPIKSGDNYKMTLIMPQE